MKFHFKILNKNSSHSEIIDYFKKSDQATLSGDLCFDSSTNKTLKMFDVLNLSAFNKIKNFKYDVIIYYCLSQDLSELVGFLQISQRSRDDVNMFLSIDALCSNRKFREYSKDYNIGYQLLDYMLCNQQSFLLNHFLVLIPLDGLETYYTKWVKPDFIYNKMYIYGDFFKCDVRGLFFLIDIPFLESSLDLKGYFTNNKKNIDDIDMVSNLKDLMLYRLDYQLRHEKLTMDEKQQVEKKINEIIINPLTPRLLEITLIEAVRPFREFIDISNLFHHLFLLKCSSFLQ
jgi:hypothetical protein